MRLGRVDRSMDHNPRRSDVFEGYHAHGHLAAAVDAPALIVVQAGVDLNGDTPRDDKAVKRTSHRV